MASRKKKPTSDPIFDKFWAKYPRNDAKTDAFNAWIKLELTMFDLDAIFTALEWQCTSEQWSNPSFIPYGATYLRGRRWEDPKPAVKPIPQSYGRRTQGNLSSMQRFLDRTTLAGYVTE